MSRIRTNRRAASRRSAVASTVQATESTNLPLVAVTSVSEAAQTITATCAGEGSATKVDLPAHGTAVVQACSWQPMHDADLGLGSALNGTLASAQL